jgi:hypothetical protein
LKDSPNGFNSIKQKQQNKEQNQQQNQQEDKNIKYAKPCEENQESYHLEELYGDKPYINSNKDKQGKYSSI